jgi:hypothetical protein
MANAFYCDCCGRESRRDVEPHDERHIFPGPAEGQQQGIREIEFIRLVEHRELTGDRIWCGPCWDEVTAPEVSSHWRDLFESTPYNVRFWIRHRDCWRKDRCTECKQWLEVPSRCPILETTRYTLLLETAGFYGVHFKAGKPKDVRCPEHIPQRRKKAA